MEAEPPDWGGLRPGRTAESRTGQRGASNRDKGRPGGPLAARLHEPLSGASVRLRARSARGGVRTGCPEEEGALGEQRGGGKPGLLHSAQENRPDPGAKRRRGQGIASEGPKGTSDPDKSRRGELEGWALRVTSREKALKFHFIFKSRQITDSCTPLVTSTNTQLAKQPQSLTVFTARNGWS